MEIQGKFSEFWDNPFFVFVRFILAVAVVCIAEYSLHQAFPLLLVWSCLGASAIIWIIVMCICRGGAKSDTVVMMRLLRRYRRGGILQAEDSHAVQYWQSIGYMCTGFTDKTPDQEPVSAARFTSEGLELFFHKRFQAQPGVWPSLKRFSVGLANM